MADDPWGTVLEVCDCYAIRPRRVGEDPDGGRWAGRFAWSAREGTVDGVDGARSGVRPASRGRLARSA